MTNRTQWFMALTLALAATSVSARDHALGSALGLLPALALFFAIGQTVAPSASVTGRAKARR